MRTTTEKQKYRMRAILQSVPRLFPAALVLLLALTTLSGHPLSAKPLAADSALGYSTYLGGHSNDWGDAIAVDDAGNVYLTGYTESDNFFTVNPVQPAFGGGSRDAFVAKFDRAGNLIYSTYLGGNCEDIGRDIAVDANGNAYIVGETCSSDFPIVGSPFQASLNNRSHDAFVVKLNPAGELVYSTYLGGSRTELGLGIAVDSAGYIYVTGVTESPDFPTSAGAHDADCGTDGACNDGYDDVFVTKLNVTGSALVYSTYLGGSRSEYGFGIAVDGAGKAYVTGTTHSFDFPTVNPVQATHGGGPDGRDAFVTKLNAAGSALIYSTYLRGSRDDDGFGIAVDVLGNAYVVGTTQSDDLPTTRHAFQPAFGGYPEDAFVTKLDPTGSAFVYSTFVGGSRQDIGLGIAVDVAGNAHITGYVYSPDFPTASPIQAAKGGDWDAFVTKLDAAGSALVYSTYLGGSDHDQGNGIAMDASGSIYVTGSTRSLDFPLASPTQPAHGTGWYDAFVSKIVSPSLASASPNLVFLPLVTSPTR